MPLVFLGELLVGFFSGSSGSIGFGFGFGVWGSSSSLVVLPSVVISSLLTLRISSSSSVGCCGCGYLEAIFVVVGGLWFVVCCCVVCVGVVWFGKSLVSPGQLWGLWFWVWALLNFVFTGVMVGNYGKFSFSTFVVVCVLLCPCIFPIIFSCLPVFPFFFLSRFRACIHVSRHSSTGSWRETTPLVDNGFINSQNNNFEIKCHPFSKSIMYHNYNVPD